MRIGLKIDIGFAENETYRRLYGDRDILRYLQELGLEAVETPTGPDTDEQALQQHIQLCCEVGLRLSLHPYTEKTEYNPTYFAPDDDNACLRLHERFLSFAAEAARLQQVETVINIHAAAGTMQPARRTLIEQSIRFFNWARQWCETNAPLVRPVAELQIRPKRNEPIQRIGDIYDELLEVTERSDVAACWDVGHAVMNHRDFGLPLDPPPELLPRFAHVHCHDVNHEDHQPLIFGNVPWERFLTELVAHNFEGTVILELTPDRFLPHEGIRDLNRSIEALVKFANEHSIY